MTEKDIRELLENLGSKVSILAEENRVCNNHDEAGRKLIKLLEEYITEEDWAKIYHTTKDTLIKEIMLDWGADFFPKDFNK